VAKLTLTDEILSLYCVSYPIRYQRKPDTLSNHHPGVVPERCTSM